MKEKNYTCNFDGCNASFGQNGTLQTHIKCVHLEQREYTCEFDGCDASFGEKGNLQKHIKTVHLKQRNYVCEFDGCNGSFGHNNILQRHIASHYNSWLTDRIVDKFPLGRPMDDGFYFCIGSTLNLVAPDDIPKGIPVQWLDKCGVGHFCCHGRIRDFCGIENCDGGSRVCKTCNTRKFSSDPTYTIDGAKCCVTCFFKANPPTSSELSSLADLTVTSNMWFPYIPDTRYESWDGYFYVYIFELVSNPKIVKIGYSKAPVERLDMLQAETFCEWHVHSCARFDTCRDAWAVEQFIQDKTKVHFEDLVGKYGFPIFGGRSEIRNIDAATIVAVVESVNMEELHNHVLGIVTADMDHRRGSRYLRNTL